jgi:hypothetical protein
VPHVDRVVAKNRPDEPQIQSPEERNSDGGGTWHRQTTRDERAPEADVQRGRVVAKLRGASADSRLDRRLPRPEFLGPPESAPFLSTLGLLQVSRRKKSLVCGAFSEPSDGLEPSTPSLPCALSRNRWQSDAAVCRDFRRCRNVAICLRLSPAATPRLHKCSTFRAERAPQIRVEIDLPHDPRPPHCRSSSRLLVARGDEFGEGAESYRSISMGREERRNA